jgi:hypothetical protein
VFAMITRLLDWFRSLFVFELPVEPEPEIHVEVELNSTIRPPPFKRSYTPCKLPLYASGVHQMAWGTIGKWYAIPPGDARDTLPSARFDTTPCPEPEMEQ